jgi:hypothetical protein
MDRCPRDNRANRALAEPPGSINPGSADRGSVNLLAALLVFPPRALPSWPVTNGYR